MKKLYLLVVAVSLTRLSTADDKEVSWWSNDDNLTDQYDSAVFGSNREDRLKDRARVGVYDYRDGETGSLDGRSINRGWSVGLEARERMDHDGYVTKDDLTISTKNVSGVIGDAATSISAISQYGGLTVGATGRAFMLVDQWNDTDWNTRGDTELYGIGGDVEFADPVIGGSLLGGLKTGHINKAVGGLFSINGDNSHFGDSSMTSTKEGITSGVAVQATYNSGVYDALPTASSTPTKYGNLVGSFDGVLVGAELNAAHSTSASSSGNDKITNYVGVHISPPVKKLSSSDTNGQSLANSAFGNATGLLIEAPKTTGLDRSPSQYVGMDVRAKASFTDAVTAVSPGFFSGSGSGLTSLNASNLASGTVPTGRLNGTYSNSVNFSNSGNSFTGNGAGLVNVQSSQCAPELFEIHTDIVDSFGGGIMTPNDYPGGAVWYYDTFVDWPGGAWTAWSDGIDGPYASIVGGSVVAQDSFYGDGIGLTDVPAAELTGTVPDAALSSNVPKKNAANAFTGGGIAVNGRLGVNTSTVPITGAYTQGVSYSRAINTSAKTAPYTATDTDSFIRADSTSTAFTVTLPTAVGRTGQVFTVKRINGGSNTVTVGTTSSQTMDGAASCSLTAQWSAVTVISDGTNWLIQSKM